MCEINKTDLTVLNCCERSAGEQALKPNLKLVNFSSSLRLNRIHLRLKVAQCNITLTSGRDLFTASSGKLITAANDFVMHFPFFFFFFKLLILFLLTKLK